MERHSIYLPCSLILGLSNDLILSSLPLDFNCPMKYEISVSINFACLENTCNIFETLAPFSTTINCRNKQGRHLEFPLEGFAYSQLNSSNRRANNTAYKRKKKRNSQQYVVIHNETINIA